VCLPIPGWPHVFGRVRLRSRTPLSGSLGPAPRAPTSVGTGVGGGGSLSLTAGARAGGEEKFATGQPCHVPKWAQKFPRDSLRRPSIGVFSAVSKMGGVRLAFGPGPAPALGDSYLCGSALNPYTHVQQSQLPHVCAMPFWVSGPPATSGAGLLRALGQGRL